MYGDQSGEFVCGYRAFKGLMTFKHVGGWNRLLVSLPFVKKVIMISKCSVRTVSSNPFIIAVNRMKHKSIGEMKYG